MSSRNNDAPTRRGQPTPTPHRPSNNTKCDLDDEDWPFSVSWEWPDGSGGYIEFDTLEDAENAADALPDGCRVWLGPLMVRQGYIAADDAAA
jgi:hypothetical protein